jgi:hypothetical protein
MDLAFLDLAFLDLVGLVSSSLMDRFSSYVAAFSSLLFVVFEIKPFVVLHFI